MNTDDTDAAWDQQEQMERREMEDSSPLTWDELADLYDAAHNGRKARTLPMETVFDWGTNQPNLRLSQEGTLHHA